MSNGEKHIEASGVLIQPVTGWNKWNHLFTAAIALMFFVVMLLGWREAHVRETSLKEINEAHETAINQFKKDTAALRKSVTAFQNELEVVKKSTIDAEAFKKDMNSEFITTRKMIDSIRKTVERMEKKSAPNYDK